MKVFKLIYPIEGSKKIRVFDPVFVKKNKSKFKILYNNKIYPLQSEFEIPDKKFNKLKIKLICYTDKYQMNYIALESESFKLYERKNYAKKNMNIYRYTDILKSSIHEILKLIYKIGFEEQEQKQIQIFGEKFVRNNMNKCIIIYKDKRLPLQANFKIENLDKEDLENKKLELFLIEIEDLMDRSYMFYECESLIEVTLSKEYKIKQNSIIEENDLDLENSKKYNNFYPNDIEEKIKFDTNKSSSINYLFD